MMVFFYIHPKPYQMDFKSIPYGKAIPVIFILFFLVCAPLWFIYDFYPGVFKLELIKLVLICVAVSFPGILIHRLILGQPDEELSDEDSLYEIAGSGLISSFKFFIPSLIFFIFSIERNSYNHPVIVACIVEAGALLLTIVIAYYEHKNRKGKSA